jgi:hypothetical protein
MANTLFAQKRIWFSRECKHIIDAFRTAVWDADVKEKKGAKDVRLDDGTSDIDSLDAFEYSLCMSMNQLETAGHKWDRQKEAFTTNITTEKAMQTFMAKGMRAVG